MSQALSICPQYCRQSHSDTTSVWLYIYTIKSMDTKVSKVTFDLINVEVQLNMSYLTPHTCMNNEVPPPTEPYVNAVVNESNALCHSGFRWMQAILLLLMSYTSRSLQVAVIDLILAI